MQPAGLKKKLLMVPDFDPLKFPIRGHTMITTSTDEDGIYLIGGLRTSQHIDGTTSIHKLQNVSDGTGRTKTFR